MDGSDSNGHAHQPNNAFLDRDTLASLLLGNQSPTSAGVSSSVDEWADSAGDLLVELDNLSMLSQICDSVPRLPPKQTAAQRSMDQAK